jgi:hypothetical protein
MSLCIFGDGFPAAPRAAQPDRCWSHQRDPLESYPVLVTYTEVHVLWVSADSQQDAVDELTEPWELTNSETRASCWNEVKAPDRWDWDTVYNGDWPYSGLDCNAHVEVYRSRQRALASTAEAVPAS